MEIDLEELQKNTFMLLSKLRKNNRNILVLNNDYYWDIPIEELYDPYVEPKNMSLGQLSEDLECLNNNINNDSAIPYDIKRLANILIAISNENPTLF